MSIGALTKVDGTGQEPSAPMFVDRVSFAGDSSYPTGGTPAFAAKLQALTKSGRKPFAVFSQGCGGYVVEYDEAADKLKVLATGASSGAVLAEVTNTTNLSAVTFNVVIISQ